MRPPRLLSEPALERWRLWSRLALQRGKLSKRTAPAFAALCEADADLAQLRQGEAPRHRAEIVALVRLTTIVTEGLRAFGLAPRAPGRIQMGGPSPAALVGSDGPHGTTAH